MRYMYMYVLNLTKRKRQGRKGSNYHQVTKGSTWHFILMQLRIYNEYVVHGIHSNLEESRGGNGMSTTRSIEHSNTSSVGCPHSDSITYIHSYPPLSINPAKEIESHSMCYQQPNELNQRRSSGIITKKWYSGERVSYVCAIQTKR